MTFTKHLLYILLLASVCVPGVTKAQGLKIVHLTGEFYVYTTYKVMDGSPFPSNSMYLVTPKGVVLFDTPWDTAQFQPLLDSIQLRHHQKVVMCIATHFHDDRTIGLTFLRQHGVKTYTSLQTDLLCQQNSNSRAQYVFTNDTIFNVGGYSFLAYWPGKGHTADNIVIWFGKQKILYGGCLIKSTSNVNIGNIADADVTAWPQTITNLIAKFPDAQYVIPGHFGWSGMDALRHTLDLLRKKGQ